MSRLLQALALSGLLANPDARAANIIDSIYGIGAGSFETPGHGASTYQTLPTNSTAMTGWTVDTGTIDWVKTSIWNASDGGYSIDMNGSPSGIGGIRTVIPTTAGTTYRITFDIAAFNAPGSATDPKTMDVTAAGATTSFSLAASHTYTTPFNLPLTVTWNGRFVEFVATSSSTTIGFRSTVTGDGSAMLLDNVSVTAVPEASAALLAAMGVMIPLAARRRGRA